MEERKLQFERLLGIIHRLRGPHGCPWDRAQTLESMRSCLLEECWEVLEAINRKDREHLREELGDLLLNILLLCDIAECDIAKQSGKTEDAQTGETDAFLGEVLSRLCDKLLRRHPHVFGTAQAADEQEALSYWQKAKESESVKGSALAGVYPNQAALLYALKLQKRAAKAGFDWEPVRAGEGIMAKISEELAEFREEVLQREELEKQGQDGDREGLEEELGDLLFSVVNLARFYKINPELALGRSSEKFRNRFSYVEQQGCLADKTIEELEVLWQEAKKKKSEVALGSSSRK
ncbi:MAG: nucleoside triphosphate pyrophosphohydrolase [Spirochaetota bacterium]